MAVAAAGVVVVVVFKVTWATVVSLCPLYRPTYPKELRALQVTDFVFTFNIAGTIQVLTPQIWTLV